MRSRERLIEVLLTVNQSAVPFFDFIYSVTVGACMRNGINNAVTYGQAVWLSENAASPHIRELAAEALHYLKEEH